MKKSIEILALMEAINPGCLDRVLNMTCATCSGEIDPDNFHDTLSRREYEISGMCQKCQDNFFGVD